jgi:putative SOS response-associated peptidase YedK
VGAKLKEPHLIEMADGSPFAFAGIWETWRPQERPAIESCSMITTEPNSLMAQIHDRMPVILPPEVWDHWLSDTEDVSELLPLLTSYPSARMRERIVDSPLKRSVADNSF